MGLSPLARFLTMVAIASPCTVGTVHSSEPERKAAESDASLTLQCPTCRIRLVQVATLHGSGDSVLLDERGTVARDRDGNYFVWTSERGRIAKFDRLGRLLSVFGRSGSGPGEFGANFGPIVPLPDGRLAVFEPGAISILKSDLKFESRLRQPVRVMGNPVAISARQIVVPGLLSSSEAIGYPLHVFDIVDGAISSFGADVQKFDSRKCSACITRHLASADTFGGLWVAKHRSYQLEHWQYRQRSRVAVVRPVVPWFPAAIGNGLENGELAANSTIPVVRALWRDSVDRLFVLGGAAADGKVQRQRPPARGSVSPTPNLDVARRKEVLDVIDSRTGARLATLELAAPPYYKSMGSGYLSSTEEDEEGAVRVRVFRVVLSTNTSGGK